jgi:hypothetical protein
LGLQRLGSSILHKPTPELLDGRQPGVRWLMLFEWIGDVAFSSFGLAQQIREPLLATAY